MNTYPSTKLDKSLFAMLGVFMFLTAGMTHADPYEEAVEAFNTQMIKGILAYGDAYYVEEHHLINRADVQPGGRINIAQHSAEYAAVLLDTNSHVDRANAIVHAVLDHQWTQPGERTWHQGNFIWWQDQDTVQDPNAVTFLTPWLCYIALKANDRLEPEARERLLRALPLCVQAIRNHPGAVYFADNHWLLRVAGLAMIARVLDQPELIAEAETRLDEWIALTSTRGLSEFNSPCYTAVSIFALEWVVGFAPDSAESLRAKAERSLLFLYADAFQNWHGSAHIGAGTHSRAYARDAELGESLTAFLINKHCGGELRAEIRPFEYAFVVNDFRVPEQIRAAVFKDTSRPLWLEATHPVYDTPVVVERSLLVWPEISLATQTGRRPHREQDIPFKITYAGSKIGWRASFLRAVPSHSRNYGVSPVRLAALQHHDRAIVVYEADMEGSKAAASMLLQIEPAEGGMIEEFYVDGARYDRTPHELEAGTTLGWRVADGLVAMRLLRAVGEDAGGDRQLIRYTLGSVNDPYAGVHGAYGRPEKILSLEAALAGASDDTHRQNDLSAGFIVRIARRADGMTLRDLCEALVSERVRDEIQEGTRSIAWESSDRRLELEWDGPADRVVSRRIDGRPTGAHPLYRSPLIHMAAGDVPRVHLSSGE